MTTIPPPTSPAEFILWFAILVIMGFGAFALWLGRKVYPEWIKQQHEIEELRVKSITSVCEETARMINSHTQEDIKIQEQQRIQLERLGTIQQKILDKLNNIETEMLREQLKELKHKE